MWVAADLLFTRHCSPQSTEKITTVRSIGGIGVQAVNAFVLHGVRVDVLKADLTQKAEVLKLEQRLRSDSSINLLVNNAGVAVNGLLANADPDQLENLIQLNVTALTRLASAAAAAFTKAGRGTIINIASVVALFPERFNATYSASKAYVLSLTQSLNTELEGTGVKVQAVLPGVTRTEIWERSGFDASGIPAEMVMKPRKIRPISALNQAIATRQTIASTSAMNGING